MNTIIEKDTLYWTLYIQYFFVILLNCVTFRKFKGLKRQQDSLKAQIKEMKSSRNKI